MCFICISEETAIVSLNVIFIDWPFVRWKLKFELLSVHRFVETARLSLLRVFEMGSRHAAVLWRPTCKKGKKYVFTKDWLILTDLQ
jgi:hypothetical protein